MKTSQVVAGALIDFVGAMSQQYPLVPIVALNLPLREWAADRGLDLDQADVAGWTRELESHSIPLACPARS